MALQTQTHIFFAPKQAQNRPRQREKTVTENMLILGGGATPTSPLSGQVFEATVGGEYRGEKDLKSNTPRPWNGQRMFSEMSGAMSGLILTGKSLLKIRILSILRRNAYLKHSGMSGWARSWAGSGQAAWGRLRRDRVSLPRLHRVFACGHVSSSPSKRGPATRCTTSPI